MLLCLRGTPVLYQGDEIGQPDTVVPHELMKDPLGVLYWPAYDGRDAMRTPMQWEDRPGGGFTAPDVQPWLPLGDLRRYNVEAQRGDPDSILGLTRDLIALRRSVPDLRQGSYATLSTTPGAWAWGRGDHVVVLAGMSAGDAVLEEVSGTVILATDGRRRGERVEGRLSVHGWEAVVVERADR
jgi:alpha-glucosidase